jgi:hypothetical protein
MLTPAHQPSKRKRPCLIGTGTGLAPPTSVPGLTSATSAPGRRLSLPHLPRDCAPSAQQAAAANEKAAASAAHALELRRDELAHAAAAAEARARVADAAAADSARHARAADEALGALKPLGEEAAALRAELHAALVAARGDADALRSKLADYEARLLAGRAGGVQRASLHPPRAGGWGRPCRGARCMLNGACCTVHVACGTVVQAEKAAVHERHLAALRERVDAQNESAERLAALQADIRVQLRRDCATHPRRDCATHLLRCTAGRA